MNTASALTIVIPAKNEAKLIPRLLESLAKQDYSKMSSTRVLVADAHSTDGTPEIVMSFRDRLNVQVIAGGMPSVGRNRGAARADTPYILFLDADIELASASLIRRVMERAEREALQCVTTNILCRDCSGFDKAMYGTNNCLAGFMSRSTLRKTTCCRARRTAKNSQSFAAASTRPIVASKKWDTFGLHDYFCLRLSISGARNIFFATTSIGRRRARFSRHRFIAAPACKAVSSRYRLITLYIIETF